MNRADTPNMRDEVVREASTWFVELNESPLDRGVREAFDKWLRRSPEHVQAFLEVSAQWEELAPRKHAQVESVEALLALAKDDANVVSLDLARITAAADRVGGEASAPVAPAEPRSPIAFWQRRYRALVAAAVLILVAGGLLWSQLFSGVYGTQVGEQRSIILSDGSRVDLNSRSRIRVRYTQGERHIDLLEGQALFDVAQNPARPFVVRTDSTSVRALGTRFDVYRKEGGTVVTVMAGRVAVTSDLKTVALDAGAVLSAGEQLTVGVEPTARRMPTVLDSAAMEAATAWTQHRLVFKGAPLSEVVSELNRYSERQIVIRDASIGATRISGSFSSNDPADLLRFLREIGAYEVRESASQIEISRK